MRVARVGRAAIRQGSVAADSQRARSVWQRDRKVEVGLSGGGGYSISSSIAAVRSWSQECVVTIFQRSRSSFLSASRSKSIREERNRFAVYKEISSSGLNNSPRRVCLKSAE